MLSRGQPRSGESVHPSAVAKGGRSHCRNDARAQRFGELSHPHAREPLAIGYTGDVARFRNRDHFAACTGTAAIEMSSGGRITHRLSRRGNRQLNHALHIAAITQICYPHSPGRAFFERKVAQGKTKKEAVRALKRRIADTIYRQLLIDARTGKGPGGQPGAWSQRRAELGHAF